MKHLVLIFTILIYSFCAIAQANKELDSLLKVLDTEKTDSNLQKTLSRIGSFYIDNNPGKALEYFERSADLAKKLNFTLRLANNYYDIGFCHLLKGDFDKSLNNYQQSAKLYEQLKDNRRLVNSYMSIGNVFFQNKDLIRAGDYYDKAEIIIQQSKDSNQLSTLYSERGMIYDQTSKFDSALLYLEKSLLIARLINDEGLIANQLANIGLTYKHLKKTSLALQYFDSVLVLYNKMQQPPLDNIAAMYNNIGATEAQAGNYTKAIAAFNKSIDGALHESTQGIVLENYRNMADMFGNMKDYKQEAEYLKKYHHLKDSLFSSDNKNQLTQLEADYQVEKKNISLVKQEAETVNQKNQRNIFIVIAIGAILLLTTLTFFYRRIKQNNLLLQEKNIQINTQKEELQKLNQVKDRLFSIISHDLRNPLVTLRTYLTMFDNPSLSDEKKLRFKTQTQQAVIQTSDMLDNLLVWANMQIKNTATNITNIQLEDCIDDAIAAAKAQATQKNIAIIKDIAVTTAAAEHNILEITLRNIITNAIKYSNANSSIFIKTSQYEEHTCITVKDEGIGMSQQQIDALINNVTESTAGTQGEKGSGLGLFLVMELLKKINGSLKIESEPGNGSSFIIELA
jgi:signal transduction histidine kinase